MSYELSISLSLSLNLPSSLVIVGTYPHNGYVEAVTRLAARFQRVVWEFTHPSNSQPLGRAAKSSTLMSSNRGSVQFYPDRSCTDVEISRGAAIGKSAVVAPTRLANLPCEVQIVILAL